MEAIEEGVISKGARIEIAGSIATQMMQYIYHMTPSSKVNNIQTTVVIIA